MLAPRAVRRVRFPIGEGGTSHGEAGSVETGGDGKGQEVCASGLAVFEMPFRH